MWRVISVLLGLAFLISGIYLASWATYAKWFTGGHWYDLGNQMFFGIFLILLMMLAIIFGIGCPLYLTSND